MELSLQEIVETLNHYYKGQVWKAVIPIDADPIRYDEYGNLIGGLEWSNENNIVKPSLSEIKKLWNDLKLTGEYDREFPGIIGIGDGKVFYGKTSEYAQALLKDSDWAALPDVDLTDESQQSWNEYRSQLREIRSNPRQNPEWPIKPNVEYK